MDDVTIEEHLRVMVGDLVMRVAVQAAEIDALRDQRAAAHLAAPVPVSGAVAAAVDSSVADPGTPSSRGRPT